jgi:polar amino acid transport system substrate-binding protein
MKIARTPLAIVPMLTLLGALTGCGGSDSDSSSASMPQEIMDQGYLTIGTEFAREGQFVELDDGTYSGFEADLSAALGEQLGIEIRYDNTGWLGLQPALDAGEIDVAMAQLSDYAEREQSMTMVNYLRSGSDIIVPAGNPNAIASFLDLCGLNVGAWTDSLQAKLLATESDKCPDGTSITIANVDPLGDASYAAAVGTGVTDAWLTDSLNAMPTAAAYGTGNELEVIRVGDDSAGLNATPIGIGVGVTQTELVTAIQVGLQELVDNGTYQELLDQYSLQDFAVESIGVNTAVATP